jgi:hypothetical protein
MDLYQSFLNLNKESHSLYAKVGKITQPLLRCQPNRTCLSRHCSVTISQMYRKATSGALSCRILVPCYSRIRKCQTVHHHMSNNLSNKLANPVAYRRLYSNSRHRKLSPKASLQMVHVPYFICCATILRLLGHVQAGENAPRIIPVPTMCSISGCCVEL